VTACPLLMVWERGVKMVHIGSPLCWLS